MTFIFMGIHYPDPTHREKLLAGMAQIVAEMRDTPGLLHIGDFQDDASERIFTISLWESRDAFETAGEKLRAAFRHAPYGEWEGRSLEALRLDEIRPPH